MTQQSSAEDRYAALLAPIRDLAQTWNVDVAHELEEYLEELESITFTFEDGPSLNFAEAALLIQGSTCIYSKKVEYLHSLVYQALEFVSDRKKREGKSKVGAGGGGGGADDDDEFDEEEQFLSLDDTLEEGTGIDLDEGAMQPVAAALRPPATLLALEDGAATGSGDGDTGSYRLAACAVHRSGALLLEPRDGDLLDENLQPMSSNNGGGIAARRASMDWAAAQAAGAVGPSATADDTCDLSGGGGDLGGGMASDDDDMGGGWAGADDYGWEGPAPQEDGAAEGGALREAAGPRSALRQQHQHRQVEEFFDPYKPLDPNSVPSAASKPFRKMSRVARKPKARLAHRPPTAALLAAADSLLTLQPPAGPGLLFPEFASALRALEGADRPARQGASSRATSQRSAQTALGGMAAAFAYDPAAGAGLDDEEGADDYDADYYGGVGDDDDDYGPVAPEFALPELEEGAGAGAAPEAPAWMDDAGSSGVASGDYMTYEELCRAHIEAFISAAAAAEVQTDLAARVSSWRAKIQPVLEEEDARPEFDIHVYGERLLDRMAALTHADDVAPEAVAAGELPAVTFAHVMAGTEQQYSVSRSFSSLLQLINNGNVRITKLGADGDGGPSNGEFELTLLDRVLPHAARLQCGLGAGMPAAEEAATQQQTAAAKAGLQELESDEEGAEENQGRQPSQQAAMGALNAPVAKAGKAGSKTSGKAAAKRRKA